MGIILDRFFPGFVGESFELESGHVLEPLSKEEKAKQDKDWKGYPHGLVRLTPGRWLFPANFVRYADRIYNFQTKSSDVFVMTYPKCGTTWTQEIVWTMRNNPNLDNPDAQKFIFVRSPFLEMDMMFHKPSRKTLPSWNDPLAWAFIQLCPFKNPLNGIMLQMSQAIPDPRTIKTHLPFSLLPPTLLDVSKVVYMARNPKDVIVSYHHHCRINTMQDYVGSFEDFVQYFVDDDLMYGPYWLHLKEVWARKDHPNLHVMFFEDMKSDPLRELRRLNDFLNTDLTETQLENIAKYTSFDEMKVRIQASGFNEDVLPTFKKNVVKADGGFFRKGESGNWKERLTPELDEKVDKWIQEYTTDLGVDFKFGV